MHVGEWLIELTWAALTVPQLVALVADRLVAGCCSFVQTYLVSEWLA
jgi:hypothetical protein